jgi:hypothetical protein
MSLRAAYEAELRRVQDSEDAAGAPRREALDRLRRFYEEIVREGLPDTSLEVEFRDEELLIDPGAVMITVKVTEEGAYRLFYEVKRPDDYVLSEVPGVSSIEDLEQAIARLMVQHR